MPETHMIDHLFRHHYGKMVAILTRIFGLRHLDTIEDAVQDTFINAMKAWQGSPPDNPEAWLVKAAKNRTLDLFRKLSAEDARIARMETGAATLAINELFLDHEMTDSVLRMIFAACHAALSPTDQIAFALKTVSGFSGKEIAAALLLKEETVKKRLSRARKRIQAEEIAFEIPSGAALQQRLNRVLEVIYLIFNEGFHSNRKDMLVRKELCGEAMRLAKLLLENSFTATPDSHALFALFCFHAARLESKITDQGEMISLEQQDRTRWYQPLMVLGHDAMDEAVTTDQYSVYHYEAAIAAEHAQASSYAATRWDRILMWYERLNEIEPSPFTRLNMAVVQLQRGDFPAMATLLDAIDPDLLEQRAYLYYGTYAAYAHHTGQSELALQHIDRAIALAENQVEQQYLHQKKKEYEALT